MDVPPEFFASAWQDADHPMAVVDIENQFVHVNHAFERLLGYSTSELRGRTWMEFTAQQYVGGDLASVQDIINGVTDSYRLEKDYVHRRGHKVSIVLTVRRFPREAHQPLALFSVEAPVATATRTEIKDVEKEVQMAISNLKRQVEGYQASVNVHVGDNAGNDHIGGNKAGRDVGGQPWIPIALMIAIAVLITVLVVKGV